MITLKISMVIAQDYSGYEPPLILGELENFEVAYLPRPKLF